MKQPPLIEPHSGIPFPASFTPPGGSAPQWFAGAGVQQFGLLRINLFCYRLAERLAVVVAETEHEPIHSRTLCEVLFDLYLGAEALSKQGRRSLIAGFPGLLA